MVNSNKECSAKLAFTNFVSNKGEWNNCFITAVSYSQRSIRPPVLPYQSRCYVCLLSIGFAVCGIIPKMLVLKVSNPTVLTATVVRLGLQYTVLIQVDSKSYC